MTLRRSVAFSITATLTYALSQWLLLVLLGRMTDQSTVGEFSLIISITAPLYLVIGLNLRLAQSTDARHRFRSFDYTNVQLLANTACVVVGLGILPLISLSREATWAYVVYLAAKCIESLSTNLYGLFQLADRMDYVAQSLLLRSALGPSLFAAGLKWHGSLVAACAWLAVAWTLVQMLDRARAAQVSAVTGRGSLYNWRAWGHAVPLVKHAWPLGVSGGVNSLTVNVPRYVVQGAFGSAALGAFAPIAYLAQVIQTVVAALGAAVIPRLSQQLAAGQVRSFIRLVWQTVAFTLGVIIVTTTAAALLGGPFLRLTMGPEYSDVPLLIAMTGAVGVGALYRCPGRGLQAASLFRSCLVLDIFVLATTGGLSLLLVPAIGAIGVAAALAIASAFGLIGASLILTRRLRALALPA